MVDNRIIDTIIAEAGGESDQGLAAVIWTIANRADIRRQTPLQVVSAPHQYTGYSSPGPDARRAMGDPNVRARAERIYGQVMSGEIPDPTGGADHYHTRAVNPSWNARMDNTANIGGHRFFSSGARPSGTASALGYAAAPTPAEADGLAAIRQNFDQRKTPAANRRTQQVEQSLLRSRTTPQMPLRDPRTGGGPLTRAIQPNNVNSTPRNPPARQGVIDALTSADLERYISRSGKRASTSDRVRGNAQQLLARDTAAMDAQFTRAREAIRPAVRPIASAAAGPVVSRPVAGSARTAVRSQRNEQLTQRAMTTPNRMDLAADRRFVPQSAIERVAPRAAAASPRLATRAVQSVPINRATGQPTLSPGVQNWLQTPLQAAQARATPRVASASPSAPRPTEAQMRALRAVPPPSQNTVVGSHAAQLPARPAARPITVAEQQAIRAVPTSLAPRNAAYDRANPAIRDARLTSPRGLPSPSPSPTMTGWAPQARPQPPVTQTAGVTMPRPRPAYTPPAQTAVAPIPRPRPANPTMPIPPAIQTALGATRPAPRVAQAPVPRTMTPGLRNVPSVATALSTTPAPIPAPRSQMIAARNGQGIGGQNFQMPPAVPPGQGNLLAIPSVQRQIAQQQAQISQMQPAPRPAPAPQIGGGQVSSAGGYLYRANPAGGFTQIGRNPNVPRAGQSIDYSGSSQLGSSGGLMGDELALVMSRLSFNDRQAMGLNAAPAMPPRRGL